MMMLLIFTVLLGYDMKSAVGTSIFIMTFIAAVGAVSHYAFIGTAHHITALAVCVVTTPIAAVIAARYANRVSNRVLNLAVGVSLSMIGARLPVESCLRITRRNHHFLQQRFFTKQHPGSPSGLPGCCFYNLLCRLFCSSGPIQMPYGPANEEQRQDYGGHLRNGEGQPHQVQLPQARQQKRRRY